MKMLIRTSLIIVLCLLSCTQGQNNQCQLLTCSESSSTNSTSCLTQNQDSQSITMNNCHFGCKFLLSDILTSEGEISYENFIKIEQACKHPKQLSDRLKYSGEKCDNDAQCHSNKCTDLQCVGASEGETCNDTKNIFCDQKLTCNDFKCKKPLDIGQPCLNSSQCQANSFCDQSKLICTEGSQEVHLQALTLSPHCKDFEVTKLAKCIELNDNPSERTNNLAVLACPKNENCEDVSVHCNLFNQQYKYVQRGNIPSGLHKYLATLQKSILTKNEFCPKSLQFTQECSLITEDLIQFNEASTIFHNFARIINMPQCLLENLKYPQIYKLLLSEHELTQISEETNSFKHRWMVFAGVIIFGILAYAGMMTYKKKKADSSQKLSQNGDLLPQSILTDRVVNDGKLSSVNVSLRNDNKEQLNLERNPTAGKVGELDISQNQDNLENPKKEGFELSVHQNFFSIDGQDEEKEEKEVESLGDSQSEGDMSYENVFNLEGENVEKHQKKRRRATNRKKIVKKDSEKKYEVVEE